MRVAPPFELIEFLDSLSYEVCFCLDFDLKQQGLHQRLRYERVSRDMDSLPIAGRQVPAMTDLVAIPRENLISV